MTTSNSKRPARRSRRGFAQPGSCWLVACLALAALLALQGFAALRPSRPPAGRSEPGTSARALATAAPAQRAAYRTRYTPIERVRVGQRVATPGTEPSSEGATAVDPRTWKAVRLRGDARWADGTADPVEVELLRPAAWLAANDIRLGSRVPMPVDLADIGSPGDPGAVAEVTSIAPCPPVQRGPGRVVLATVTHLNAEPLKLTIADGAGRSTVVQTTAPHRFYSEDRNSWMAARDLHPGERLRGRSGPLTVASAESRPGPARVYNLTVEGEHVFFVSALNLLTHNQSSPPEIPKYVYRSGGKNPGALTPRPKDEGMLSTRDSISNPWPKPDTGAVIRDGEPIQVIDTSKLPPGTVVPDGQPYGPAAPGHVSIGPNVPGQTVKGAVVQTVPPAPPPAAGN